MVLVTEEGVGAGRGKTKRTGAELGLGSQGRGFADQEGRGGRSQKKTWGWDCHLSTHSGSKFIPAYWEGTMQAIYSTLSNVLLQKQSVLIPTTHQVQLVPPLPLAHRVERIGPPYLRGNFDYCLSTSLARAFWGFCLYDTPPPARRAHSSHSKETAVWSQSEKKSLCVPIFDQEHNS